MKHTIICSGVAYMRYSSRLKLPVIGVIIAYSFGVARNTPETETQKKQTANTIEKTKTTAKNANPIKVVPLFTDNSSDMSSNIETEKRVVQKGQMLQAAPAVKIIHPNSGRSQNARGSVVQADPQTTASLAATSKGTPLSYEMLQLKPSPVLRIEGEDTWKGLTTKIQDMRTTLEEVAKGENLDIAGSPIMVFLETNNDNFQYEFMLPIKRVPQTKASLPPGVSFSLSPKENAFRFAHKGNYNRIEATYSTIAKHLSSKGILIKKIYMEEYVTDLTSIDADTTATNIFIFRK